MKVTKAERGDSGKYELKLVNSKGELKIPIEIEVIDKPSAPGGPLKVSDVFIDRATLQWRKPEDDGGSPISNYIIEKMDLAKQVWAPLEIVSGKETKKTVKCTPGKEYIYRVRAVNSEGESPNLETPLEDKILAKNPFDEPKAPGTPQISDWDKNRTDLEWTKPDSDGGAPIEKYIIEKRETPNGAWSPVSYDSNSNISEIWYDFQVYISF